MKSVVAAAVLAVSPVPRLNVPLRPAAGLTPALSAPLSAPSLAPTLTTPAQAPSLALPPAASLAPLHAPADAPGAAPAPRPGPEAWSRGSFRSEDGTRLSYYFRAGEGPAVLMVHGRGIGALGFREWEGLLPGRALMILERRGYGASELGEADGETLEARTGEDVRAAVDEASRLAGGGKVGIVAYSLGAMLLPAPDPEKVLWTAMICPAVPGMGVHLSPELRRLGALVNAGHALARWWPAAARRSWIAYVTRPNAAELVAKLRANRADGELGDHLARQLAEGAQDMGFLERFFHETLHALNRPADRPEWRGPVLIVRADRDETVPAAASDERVAALREGGADVRTLDLRATHLDLLLDPRRVLPALEAFDAAVRAAP